MMKHSFATSLAVAAVMVVPAAGLRGQEPGDLDLAGRLAATVAALEELAGLRGRIQSGEPGAVETVRAATEAPIEPAQRRDELLVELRADVGRLQMAHDELTSRSVAAEGQAEDGANAGEAEAASGEERARPSLELVRQGKLLSLDGRHAEAAELLAPHLDDPEARYWLARSFKHMGRRAEAFALWSALAEDESSGAFGARAKRDLELLRLDRELERRRAAKEERE